MSYYLPSGLLTVAILINVVRWLALIKNCKNDERRLRIEAGESIKASLLEQMQIIKQNKALNLFMVVFCFVILLIIIFKIIYQCNASYDTTPGIVENFLF